MKKVLIIEDEELTRFTVKEVLAMEGFETFEASDGVIGIKMLKEVSPDLVITDIIMPNKEGVETTMEIKRDFPSVKVIAMSGGGRTGNQNFLKMAKELGADETLAKPFSASELIACVLKVMEE